MPSHDSTASGSRESKRAALRNYPTDDTPRKYRTRKAAESVASTYRRMVFFAERGEPYAYPCATCERWHVGLDTGAKWHLCRYRHDNYEDFYGEHPESDAA